MEDPEIKAITSISAALSLLSEEQRVNVLLYINTRYGGFAATSSHAGGERQNGSAVGEFDNIGEYFDAANPVTEADRVLVVAYWIQAIEGQDEFEAAVVNKHLKNLGHTVSNITRAFDDAINQTPRLVIQTSKSGSAKQARKKYKVTREGIKKVQRMLAQGGNDNDLS